MPEPIVPDDLVIRLHAERRQAQDVYRRAGDHYEAAVTTVANAERVRTTTFAEMEEAFARLQRITHAINSLGGADKPLWDEPREKHHDA